MAGFTPPAEFDGYRLLRMLGVGGMGAVFLAQDSLLDRRVAVKFIRKDMISDAARAQFLIEAHAAARLQHPNVVTIHRIGEIDGHRYIISEYVRGQSLDRIAKPLAWRRVAEIGVAICRGLAAAHRRGILHRDLKPSNVIQGREGELKLADFGIAKLLARPQDTAMELAAVPTVSDGKDANFVMTIPEARRPAMVAPPQAATVQALEPQHVAAPHDVTMRADPQAAAPELQPPPPAPPAVPIDAENDPEADGNPPPAEVEQSTVKGTPLYMAPEVLRGEPASYRSDIYSLGVMLYEFCATRTPFNNLPMFDMAKLVNETDAPPLVEIAPSVDVRFATIIDRCLRRNPSQRFASADELRQAIEQLLQPSQQIEIPEGNPYRGLLAFEAEHRAFFFGRLNEVGTLIERLRSEPSLLVVADSGIGKSSLVRAGVLPALTAGVLRDGRAWRCVSIVPGRQPRQALLDGLGQLLDVNVPQLTAELEQEPRSLGRKLAELLKPDRGAVLFVDQLEELVTNSTESEAQWFVEAIASLSGRMGGFRLLMTARADFLSRLGALPGFGDEINRAFYLLRPLAPDMVREVIVGPARLKGVEFESDALVDELVASVAKTDGGLPLLQFALAELWEARRGNVITRQALDSIGGVVGALSRHADSIVGRFNIEQRDLVQHIFIALLTAEGTRVRRTRDALTHRGAAVSEVLEVLVKGRLLLARDSGEGPTFEVAHEALIRNWGTLQRWLEAHGERRAVRQRVEEAAREWHRLGQQTEGLWSSRQLGETNILESTDLGPGETRFLAACRRRVRHARIVTWAIVAMVPMVSALVYGGVRWANRQSLQRRVTELVMQSRQRAKQVLRIDADVLATWQRSMLAFDTQKPQEAETAWRDYRKKDEQRRAQYDQIFALLKSAQQMSPQRADVQATMATVWDQLAQSAHDEQRFERRERYLKEVGDHDRSGKMLIRWQQPGQVRIATTPSGAATQIFRYALKDKRYLTTDARTLASTPVGTFSVDAGSYLVTLSLAGHAPVNYPFVIHTGQSLDVAVKLPKDFEVPAGFIYIPEGRFLFGVGGNDDEQRANVYRTAPLHPVETAAFLISRNETTYADWIQYLEARAREERGFVPQIDPIENGRAVSLQRGRDGQWQLEMLINSVVHRSTQGGSLTFGEPEIHKPQNWLRLPVSGISRRDAEGYTAWLARSGRVPNARLCTELEWERAARGADERDYPNGDVQSPGDANYEDTYGEDGQNAGPDEVGSYPASRSPFGVDDMTGNIAEWTVSSLRADQSVLRGGSFYSKRAVRRIPSRRILNPDRRDVGSGFRVCAPPK